MNIEIEKKVLKKSLKIMNNIYNTLVLLSNYCDYKCDIEDIENISPVIKYLTNEGDILYYNFSNIEQKLREQCKEN